MSRALITQATQLFFGKAWHPGAHDSRLGVEFTPLYLYESRPANGDNDGVCTTQAVNQNAPANLNGALVVNGQAVFDVPRNVVAAWTGTATLRIEGYDQYGEFMVEVTGTAGTSHTGKKAFQRVTRVVPSANVTGLTVGSGNVLGLPYRADAGAVLLSLLAGQADAGTFVAADTTAPTATTGDVRGTYAPAGTLNGTNLLQILMKIANPAGRVGAYGLRQYGG